MFKARTIFVLSTMACGLLAFSASAVAAEFRSSTSPETILAEGGEQIFTIGSFAVVCETIKMEDANQTFPTPKLTDKVVYGPKCKIPSLKVEAKVVCEGTFEFNASGTVTIAKPGCTIAAAGGVCTITVPGQGPLTSVNYTNVAGGTIIIQGNVSAIAYEAKGVCGIAAKGTATYKGEAKARASAGGTVEWS